MQTGLEYRGYYDIGKILFFNMGEVIRVTTNPNNETGEGVPFCIDEFVQKTYYTVSSQGEVSSDGLKLFIATWVHGLLGKVMYDGKVITSEILNAVIADFENMFAQMNMNLGGIRCGYVDADTFIQRAETTIRRLMNNDTAWWYTSYYRDIDTSFQQYIYGSQYHWLGMSMTENVLNTVKVIGVDGTNKQGRFTKRFQAEMYKRGIKLNPSAMSSIGNAFNECMVRTRTYYIEITNNFSWRDGRYGKEDSCWWGTYSASRDTLYNSGGYGILFYPDSDRTSVFDGIGRVWVFPNSDESLVVFNAYGVGDKESAGVVCQLMHDMTGRVWSYAKRDIFTNVNGPVPYINGCSGYIVYPKDDPMASENTLCDFDIVNGIFTMSPICPNCGVTVNHEGNYCGDCGGEDYDEE